MNLQPCMICSGFRGLKTNTVEHAQDARGRWTVRCKTADCTMRSCEGHGGQEDSARCWNFQNAEHCPAGCAQPYAGKHRMDDEFGTRFVDAVYCNCGGFKSIGRDIDVALIRWNAHEYVKEVA